MHFLISIFSILTLSSPSLAQFDNFEFSLTTCPGNSVSFPCVPPSVCAWHTNMGKYYCCDPGEGSVCWSGGLTCSGGSNGSNSAGPGQTSCGSWCCSSGREECTQRYGQAGVCWSTETDPFHDTTEKAMNQSFSSLSSATPSATLWKFAPSSSSTVAVSTSSSMSSLNFAAAPTLAGSPPASTSASSAHGSGGISGGAIAGIVIGAIIALLLVFLLAFLIGRRSGLQYQRASSSEGDEKPANVPVGGRFLDTSYEKRQYQTPVTEVAGSHASSELPDSFYRREMPDRSSSRAKVTLPPQEMGG